MIHFIITSAYDAWELQAMQQFVVNFTDEIIESTIKCMYVHAHQVKSFNYVK